MKVNRSVVGCTVVVVVVVAVVVEGVFVVALEMFVLVSLFAYY